MSKKRILALVTNVYAVGGISRFNFNFLEALASSENVKEIIVASRDKANYSFSKPSLFNLEVCCFSKITYIYEVLKLLYKFRSFDVIFCGHILTMPLAAIIGKVLKIPVWLQIHGIEAWQKPSPMLRWAVQQASWVTSVSRYTRNQFCKQFEFDSHLVKILPNTVDDCFKPGEKSKSLLQRYNLENKKIILTVSRLVKEELYKGHGQVISVLPQLLREFPNVSYVIAGDGDDKERLKQLAHSYNIDKHVSFINQIPDFELPELYRLADLFIMPSTREGFGIVFLEAIRTGLPVIAGNIDGSVDALRDGQLGLLIDPRDPSSVLNAMSSALRGEIKPDFDKADIFLKHNFVEHCEQLLNAFS